MSSLFTYDNFVHAVAGSVANATAMTVFYPLDTVRSRLQLEGKRKAKNTLATMKDIVQEEGLSSLYRGLEPVLYSLFTSGFVYFYSFHGLRRVAGEKTTVKDLAIGVVAGSINVLTTTPLWVVNTRIKMQGSRQLKQSSSVDSNKTEKKLDTDFSCITDGLIKIIQHEGPGALWAGTAPSLVLTSNPAIQFAIFELLKRNLKQMLNKEELSPYHVFALGAISKSISTVLTYPLQVVQSKRRYGSAEVKDKSVVEILNDLVKEGTLYRGMEAKLMQTVMTTSLMFVFYEKIYSFVTKVGKSI